MTSQEEYRHGGHIYDLKQIRKLAKTFKIKKVNLDSLLDNLTIPKYSNDESKKVFSLMDACIQKNNRTSLMDVVVKELKAEKKKDPVIAIKYEFYYDTDMDIFKLMNNFLEGNTSVSCYVLTEKDIKPFIIKSHN